MKSALIGYSGFIGTNLKNQTKFTDYYDKDNIEKIRGKKYDLIVSAATRAERWWANQNPNADWKGIKELLDNLKNVSAKHFVLISTVDVYPNPNNATEDYKIKTTDFKQAYGLNRFKMENFVRKHFPKITVLRLPQTYGIGLKKNFVYDLIHDNALDFTHKDSLLQFYNLDNLWKDTQRAIKENLEIFNLAVEPVTAQELAKYTRAIDFKTITKDPSFSYNMKTQHGTYLYKKSTVLRELKKFIEKERSKTKIAVSNLGWNKKEEEAIIPILKIHQISGVELSLSKVWDNPTEASDTDISEYKKKWDTNGIKIVAVTSLLFGHPELTIFEFKARRDKTLDYLKKMVVVTQKLGAKIMIFGSPKNRLVGNSDKDKSEKIAISFFKKIGAYAKKYGVTFCIEPVPATYGSDFILLTKESVKVVKKIGSDNVRVNMDTGEMKINKSDFTDTINKSIKFAGHMHISEPGFGTVANNKFGHKLIAKAIKEKKYDKWVSIETWAKEDADNVEQIQKSIEFVKKIYE